MPHNTDYVSRNIIYVEPLGNAEALHRLHEVTDEGAGVFGQVEPGCYNVTGGVVEDGVQVSFFFLSSYSDFWPMKEIGRPQVTEVGKLETADRLHRLDRVPVQSSGRSEPVNRGKAGFATIPQAFLLEQDQYPAHRPCRMLFPGFDNRLLQRHRHRSTTFIASHLACQAFQAGLPEQVEPVPQGVRREVLQAAVGQDKGGSDKVFDSLEERNTLRIAVQRFGIPKTGLILRILNGTQNRLNGLNMSRSIDLNAFTVLSYQVIPRMGEYSGNALYVYAGRYRFLR